MWKIVALEQNTEKWKVRKIKELGQQLLRYQCVDSYEYAESKYVESMQQKLEHQIRFGWTDYKGIKRTGYYQPDSTKGMNVGIFNHLEEGRKLYGVVSEDYLLNILKIEDMLRKEDVDETRERMTKGSLSRFELGKGRGTEAYWTGILTGEMTARYEPVEMGSKEFVFRVHSIDTKKIVGVLSKDYFYELLKKEELLKGK